MKIVILYSNFPKGGAGTACKDIAKELANRGHEVHVFSRGEKETKEEDGYTVHVLPYSKKPLFRFLSYFNRVGFEMEDIGEPDAIISLPVLSEGLIGVLSGSNYVW